MRGESERSDPRAWLRPFWVRLCLYLTLYLCVGPLLLLAWDGGAWGERLKEGFEVLLVVVPGIELTNLRHPWPFQVRLCFYLTFYLGMVPLLYWPLIVGTWGSGLRLGVIAVLVTAPMVELITWLNRAPAQPAPPG